MDKLLEELNVEEEQINQTLGYLNQALARDEKSVIELAAIGAFIHNTYNGFENMIKRIMKFHKILIPVSNSWHKDILQSALESKIITETLSLSLDDYRAFRHFFNHGYGIGLTKEKLLPLAEKLPMIWAEFQKSYKHFLESNL